MYICGVKIDNCKYSTNLDFSNAKKTSANQN